MTGNSNHLQNLLGWERLDTVYYRIRPLNVPNNQNKKPLFDYIDNQSKDVLVYDNKKYFFDFIAEYCDTYNFVNIKTINDSETVLYTVNLNGKSGEGDENKFVSMKWDIRGNGNIVLIVVVQYGVKIIEFGDLISEREVEFVNDDDSADEIWGMKENNIILSKRQQNFYKLNIEDTAIDIIYNNSNNNDYSILDYRSWLVRKDGSIILLSSNELLLVFGGKVKKLKTNCQYDLGALSHSESFLSLFNSKFQKLVIVSTNNPSKNLVELNLKFKPKFLQWVGNDCIAALDELENEIYLYGPKGSHITFWFSEMNKVMHMETSVDGIKVYTSQNECHLISKVETYTKNIFQMGSMEQSSVLTDCFDMYQNDEISRVLPILDSLSLNSAVSEVITASIHEFEPLMQKRLLSCATWGKGFMLIESAKKKKQQDIINLNNQLQEACRKLRILNNINSLISFRFTGKEFEFYGFQNIIRFLLNRPDCFIKDGNSNVKAVLTECLKLALYVKDYKLSVSVLKTFCIRKIKYNDEKSDDELLIEISQVFDSLNLKKELNFPFSSLYNVCISENRIQLAKKLVLKDSILKRHIMPLLALEKESSDSDSLFFNETLVETIDKVGDPILQLFVLFELKHRYKSSQLARFIMLNNERIDLNLFFKILENSENSIEQFGLSYDYYIQMDDVHGLLNLIWNKNKKIGISQENALTQIEGIYKKNSSNYTKNTLLCNQVINRELKLLKYQRDLFETNEIDCLQKTANETFKLLVTLGNKKMVDRFMKEFQISEKQYYLQECLSCIQKDQADMERILVLSSQRKFNKYIHVVYTKLVANNHLLEASKLITLPNNEWPFESKINKLIECKQYEQALELAEYYKDIQAVAYVSQLIESTVI